MPTGSTPVKQESTSSKNWSSLLRKLNATYQPEDPPSRDPVMQLVIGFLQWESTRRQAEDALARLMAVMVDHNELRVSYESEIIQIVGRQYPRVEERIARLREVLNEIYIREYDVSLKAIDARMKKDQKVYLESLPGMLPYVSSQVMLLCYGGHAMPVDDKLAALLAREEVVGSDTPVEQVENTILRLVRAGDAKPAHLLLQAWSDAEKTPRRTKAGGKTRKASPVAGKKAGRSAKGTTRRTAGRTKKKK